MIPHSPAPRALSPIAAGAERPLAHKTPGLRHRRWWLVWLLLASAPAAQAQESKPAATAAVPASDAGPASGQWEVRFPVGGSVNSTGQPLESQNQGLFGFSLSRALSRQLAVEGGLSGAVDKDFFGGSALVGLRYRWWDASSIVKPFVTGGLLHSWYFPRSGKKRDTITAASMRTGFGLDFAITPRALWGVEVDFDAGPRILPSSAAFVNVNFTAGFLFLL